MVLRAECLITKADDKDGRFILTDINETGFRVSLNHDVLPGSIINLELKLPGVPIVVIGKVIWCEQKTAKSFYNKDAGIKFDNISELDKQRIIAASLKN